MTTRTALITKKELKALKMAILSSVLNEQPFPGTDIQLRFPDLPFMLAQEAMYVKDSQLKVPIPIERLQRSLEPISGKTLKKLTEKTGRTTYFKFRTHKVEQDILLIHLDANSYSAAEKRSSILSSLGIRLYKKGTHWAIKEAPTFLSA